MTNIPFTPEVTLVKLVLVLIVAFVPLSIFFGRNFLRSYQLACKLPGPSLWAILVHRKSLMSQDILKTLFNFTSEYGYKPWVLWTPLHHFTVIADPERTAEAFKSKNLLNKEEKFYRGAQEYLGTNSLVLNGPAWKVRRSALNPAFSKVLLENNLDLIYEEAARLIQDLKENANGAEFEIHEYIVNGLVRSSTRSLAIRERHLDKRVVEMISFLLHYGLPWVQMKSADPLRHFFDVHFNKDHPRYIRTRAEISDLIREVVTEVKQSVSEGMRPEMPLAVLIAANTTKNNLSVEEITNEIYMLIAASVDTTATVISAVICLLAIHPEVQRRATIEIESIFGDTNRPISSEDLPRLEYLERVIKESMRLFPPGALIMRRVEEETTLHGTIMPKGSTVIINAFALHRNPERCFQDPLKFDPDRFSPGAQEDRHPYAYLPFSTGPRNCAGRLHAMITMKTVLSTLLRNYKILPGTQMKDVLSVKVKNTFTLQLDETFVRVVPVS